MKVLVVDDDPVCQLGLEAMVRALGHECLVALDGRAAWNIMQAEQIDLLITDREMPHLDGVQLTKRVREELTSGHVYVILATAYGSLDQAREGMIAGADDYLVKPIQLDDLQLRLIAGERVNALHRTLETANQELRVVARRDGLTGLRNRRCLAEDLVVMADRMHRYGHRFSLALLDVDNFKGFNDLYGHQKGDEALKALAEVMQAMSRGGDTCYRYGGEEFLCIYPEQSIAGAEVAVERLRTHVAALAIPHEGGVADGALTLSAGISEMSEESGMDAKEAVRAADMAMYEAKKLGRNRVEVAIPSLSRLPRTG